MTLVKWNKNNSGLRTLPDLIENIFGRDLFDMANIASPGTTLPAVNIRETKDDFIVEVAAPGMKKDDFKVKVDNNVLVISSEKTHEEDDRGRNGESGDYTRREFSYQSFQRSFTLPQTVMGEKISARYTDGILHILIPKKEEAKQKPAREIQIA